MFVILVTQTCIRWGKKEFVTQLVYGRSGSKPFLASSETEAKEYLLYLQKEYSSYPDSPRYKIMELEELIHA